MEHFELAGKTAALVGAGPAADAIADAYREAGAEVVKVTRVEELDTAFRHPRSRPGCLPCQAHRTNRR